MTSDDIARRIDVDNWALLLPYSGMFIEQRMRTGTGQNRYLAEVITRKSQNIRYNTPSAHEFLLANPSTFYIHHSEYLVKHLRAIPAEFCRRFHVVDLVDDAPMWLAAVMAKRENRQVQRRLNFEATWRVERTRTVRMGNETAPECWRHFFPPPDENKFEVSYAPLTFDGLNGLVAIFAMLIVVAVGLLLGECCAVKWRRSGEKESGHDRDKW